MATDTRAAGVLVEDVSKIYYPSPGWMKFLVRSNIKQEVHALDGVSFEVGPGEICAVVGPNGAGKTTTFRILVGLTSSTTGKASVMGYDCERESVSVRQRVGWMPAEDRSLIMRLSCAENLHFHGRLQGLKGENLKERIRQTLAMVGLAHAAESSVFALSAGMRARLQLARALLANPKVLILDEPTGSVDPIASYELLNLIMEIVAEHELAVLISSHRLEEIEALHSHAILLDKGQVRFDGNLDQLRGRLDRPTLELEFGSVGAANAAAETVISAKLGELVPNDGDTPRDETSLQFVLSEGESVGQVIQALSPSLDGLTHIRELQTPLRDLLAQIYTGAIDKENL